MAAEEAGSKYCPPAPSGRMASSARAKHICGRGCAEVMLQSLAEKLGERQASRSSRSARLVTLLRGLHPTLRPLSLAFVWCSDPLRCAHRVDKLMSRSNLMSFVEMIIGEG